MQKLKKQLVCLIGMKHSLSREINGKFIITMQIECILNPAASQLAFPFETFDEYRQYKWFKSQIKLFW